MSITVKLKILGEPMGKQRPKATSINGYVRTYTPKETVNYESMVVNAYKEAINKAREWAKPGEIVIMSSIGTSYDHFRHFEHRGDMFRDLVNELK